MGVTMVGRLTILLHLKTYMALGTLFDDDGKEDSGVCVRMMTGSKLIIIMEELFSLISLTMPSTHAKPEERCRQKRPRRAEKRPKRAPFFVSSLPG